MRLRASLFLVLLSLKFMGSLDPILVWLCTKSNPEFFKLMYANRKPKQYHYWSISITYCFLKVFPVDPETAFPTSSPLKAVLEVIFLTTTDHIAGLELVQISLKQLKHSNFNTVLSSRYTHCHLWLTGYTLDRVVQLYMSSKSQPQSCTHWAFYMQKRRKR